MKTVKEKALETLRNMPDNVTIDDVMEALYARAKIDNGLKDLDEGKSITHEEAKKILSKWLNKGNK